ncbi:MAG: glycoside hydrolase family 13 protein [Proteocatella sp.]
MENKLIIENKIIEESRAIEFDSKDEFYKTPFGAVEEKKEITLRIGISRNLGQAKTKLIIIVDETNEEIDVDGKWQYLLKGKDYYEFRWIPKEPGLYFYYMKATTDDGLKHHADPEPEHLTKKFQQTVYAKGFSVPKWLGDGIMYQIFPDRFNRSAKYTPPKMNKDYVLRDDWGGEPVSKPDSKGKIKNNDFFGGNLRGIQEKLPYLLDLGVSVIYLNPIAEAYSNHRYDTGNHKKIDPMLGTSEDFKNLCQEAARQGIRIIVDGVYNHTGDDSVYFNRYRRYDNVDGPGEIGAYNSKESKYYSWYTFSQYPDKYESWWGIDSLPKADEQNPSYIDYIIRDKDSVIDNWLNLGASGFRLDVADELPDIFLEEFRKKVKGRNPDYAIIGEVWEDASNKISYNKRREYLQGKQLDSVMNYPFSKAIRDFMESKDARIIADAIETLQENYPQEAFYSLMNILGTHDTQRILTAFLRQSRMNPRKKLFITLMLWAFLPGIPCIYYGDEIGMQGGKDPLNRGCFQFEKRDEKIYNHYKDILNIRQKIQNISQYKYKTHQAQDGLYAFTRIREHDEKDAAETDIIFVAVNTGPEKTVVLPIEKVKTFFQTGSIEILMNREIKIGNLSGIIVTGRM